MGCHRATPLRCFLGSQPQTRARRGEEEHRGVLKDRTKSKPPQSQPPDMLFLTIVLLIQPCPRVVGAPRTIARIRAGCFSPKAPRLPAAPGRDPLPLLTGNLGCPPPVWHPGGTQPVTSKSGSFAPALGLGEAQAPRSTIADMGSWSHRQRLGRQPVLVVSGALPRTVPSVFAKV